MGRILTAALVGAIYTGAVFCVRWTVLTHPLMKLTVAVGMVLISTGGSRRPVRVLGLFFLLSCALAGGLLLMELTGAGRMSTGHGFPVTLSDGRMLLVCGAGEYLAVSLVSGMKTEQGTETVPVLLRCEGRTILVRVLLDSGNLLRDPLTGTPVLILEHRAARGLFPSGRAPTEEELSHPAEALETVSQRWNPSRVRLVPYQAVGTAKGMLLAVRVDEMEVDGRHYKNRLAALTVQTFNGGYQGLIGTEWKGTL